VRRMKSVQISNKTCGYTIRGYPPRLMRKAFVAIVLVYYYGMAAIFTALPNAPFVFPVGLVLLRCRGGIDGIQYYGFWRESRI